MNSSPHRTLSQPLAFAALLLAMQHPASLSAETVSIPGAPQLEASIELPPDFDAAIAYNVLVSPGNFYWQERPSQPGWITVSSDGFWGDDRIESSKRLLDWLRDHYQLRNDGFHAAGWSANSAGVFEIVARYPAEFLSITGIAGMPGAGSEGDLSNFAGLHVQFIVGENDRYWRRGSERWFELMQEAGIETTLEIIANGDHVMPEIANGPLFERLDGLVAKIESRHE